MPQLCVYFLMKKPCWRCHFWEQPCRGRGSLEEESLTLTKPTAVWFTTHLPAVHKSFTDLVFPAQTVLLAHAPVLHYRHHHNLLSETSVGFPTVETALKCIHNLKSLQWFLLSCSDLTWKYILAGAGTVKQTNISLIASLLNTHNLLYTNVSFSTALFKLSSCCPSLQRCIAQDVYEGSQFQQHRPCPADGAAAENRGEHWEDKGSVQLQFFFVSISANFLYLFHPDLHLINISNCCELHMLNATGDIKEFMQIIFFFLRNKSIYVFAE